MLFGLYNGDYELWRTRMEHILYDVVMDYNKSVSNDTEAQHYLSDARRDEKVFDERFVEFRNGLIKNKQKITEESFYQFMKDTCRDVLPERIVAFHDSQQNGLAGVISASCETCNDIIGIPNQLQQGGNGVYSITNDVESPFNSVKFKNIIEVPGMTDEGPTSFAYPISPFDNRFSDLESIYNAGTRMVYVPAEDLEGVDVVELSTAPRFISDKRGESTLLRVPRVGAAAAQNRKGINPGRFVHAKVNRRINRSGQVEYDDIVYGASDADSRLVSIADRCGISKLKSRFLNDKDFDSIKSYVTDEIVEPNLQYNGTIPNASEVTSEAELARMRADVDVAIAIIDALNEQGLRGEITKDGRKGQLRYDIPETGKRVRIFDVDEGAYVGRTYGDGTTSYLMSDEQAFINTNYNPDDPSSKLYPETRQEAAELRRNRSLSYDQKSVVYTWGDIRKAEYDAVRNIYYSQNGQVDYASAKEEAQASGDSRRARDMEYKDAWLKSAVKQFERHYSSIAGDTSFGDVPSGEFSMSDMVRFDADSAKVFRNRLVEELRFVEAADNAALRQRIDDTLTLVLTSNGLDPRKSSFFDSYDDTVNPNVVLSDSYFAANHQTQNIHVRGIDRTSVNIKEMGKNGNKYWQAFEHDIASLNIHSEWKDRSVDDSNKLEYGNTSPNFVRDAIAQARNNIAMEVGLETYVRDNKGLAQAPVGVGDLFKAAQEYKIPLDQYKREKEDLEIASRTAGMEPDFSELVKPVRPVFEAEGDVANLQREYFSVLVGDVDKLKNPNYMEVSDEELDDLGGEIDFSGILGEESVDTNSEYMELASEEELSSVYDALPESYKDTMSLDEYARFDLVQRHLANYLDSRVGTYEPGVDGKRFSIDKVSRNMGGSLIKNQSSLVAAIRRDNRGENDKADVINKDELRILGRNDEQFVTSLTTFDEGSAISLPEIISHSDGQIAEDYQRVLNKIKDTLQFNGCLVNDDEILMDSTGRIHYIMDLPNGQLDKKQENRDSANGWKTVEGEIGPIYVPDSTGYIHVKPEVGKEYLYAPGYRASILPTDVADGDVYERTRLTGYMESLERAIGSEIQTNLRSKEEHIGSPNSMFRFYRKNSANAKRREPGYEQELISRGVTPEGVRALQNAEVNTVVYDRELKLSDTSSTLTAVQNNPNNNRNEYLLANDNSGNPYGLTKHKNMAVITSEYLSTELTPSAKGQGTKVHMIPGVYLEETGNGSRMFAMNEDEAVYHDGVGKYSAVENYRTSELFGGDDYCQFDQWNRSQMAANNIQDMVGHTREPVGVCQINMAGWNQDDAFVVSKRFAEENHIKGGHHTEDGTVERFERELGVGDKLSDAHGNKGVISLVVDPDWTFEEAQARGAVLPWATFRANPDLQVAVSPFSAISRNNGGTAREIMGNGASDLNIPSVDRLGNLRMDEDGNPLYETQKASMGKISLILHDKAADKDSIVYSDTMVRAGRSRSFGWQPTTALIGRDCRAILNELYGEDSSSLLVLREHLRTCGMDIDASGNLQAGLIADENLRVLNPGDTDGVYPPSVHFGGDEDAMKFSNLFTDKGEISSTKFANQVNANLASHGGILRIPFPLKFTEIQGYENKELVTYGGETIPKADIRDDVRDIDLYDMPVMSVKLRAGVRFDDGSVSSHEYTNHYERIVDNVGKWYEAHDKLYGLEQKYEGVKKDAKYYKDKEKFETNMKDAETKAQSAFRHISDDVRLQNLSGRHNDFKSTMLSADIPHGATSVWSPNPSLRIDQVGMSSATQDKLGVKPGEHILLWRDPVLEDNNVRYVEVATDEAVQGVSVHPGMATPIAGDFDGDKVGLAVLSNAEARAEAFHKLSFEANLLDTMHGQIEIGLDDNGEPIMGYPLNYGTGLDAQVGRAMNPALAEEYDRLVRRVNEYEKQVLDNNLNMKADTWDVRRRFVEEITDNLNKSLNCQGAQKAVSYENDTVHLESIKQICVDTGAKGSTSKLFGKLSGVDETGCYSHYFGAIVDFDDDGNILSVTSNLDDSGNPKSCRTQADDNSCMVAMNAKTACTAIPGKRMQTLAGACTTHEALRAALAISQQGYQAVLDMKHDGKKAEEVSAVLVDAKKAIDRGIHVQKMEKDGKTIYQQVYSDDPMTKNEWLKSEYNINEDIGLHVEKDVLQIFADNVCDGSTDMPNIEDQDFRISRSPMAACAYSENFITVFKSADRGCNLFDDFYGSAVVPKIVKQAQKGDDISLTPRDCQKAERFEIVTPSMKDKMERVGNRSLDVTIESSVQREVVDVAQCENIALHQNDIQDSVGIVD